MAKFLCTADVHIGRSSSVGGQWADSSDYCAIAAWERMVDCAISEKADAILLAGDFYDSLSAQYESRGNIRSTLEKLKARNIPLVAVAGNHDFDALPEFARVYPELIDLFPSDDWGETTVEGIRIVGRSFARSAHRESMLSDFQFSADGRPTIGLVHADIDGVGSYGPTPLSDFRGSGIPTWVVGHIHAAKDYLDGTVAYPGSPQALDWGETGQHGARWLKISSDGTSTFSKVFPLSTVYYRYATLEIEAKEAPDDQLRRLSETILGANDQVKTVQFRVDLRVSPDDDRQFQSGVDIDNDWYEVLSQVTVPKLNLMEEATQSDAKGQAARLLLGLDGEGSPAWKERARDMVSQLHRRMIQERHALRLQPIESLEVLRESSVDDARSTVRRMLEKILTAEGGLQ